MQPIVSVLTALAGLSILPAVAAAATPKPGADGKYTLTAPGIKAQFIPYAATLTNLFVPDKNGIVRDVVLGYDNASYYPVDPNHPDYNAIPGPYASRIGNATFTLDGTVYHTQQNDGNNTLHSGTNGWSHRFFTVTAYSPRSITFTLDDDASLTAMPGRVVASVTYRVSAGKLHTTIAATAPERRTPIMATQHTYWNLDGFSDPASDLIWNHTLHTPYSKRLLAPDPNMVPTGAIPDIPAGDINDFWSAPKPLGANMSSPEWVGNCGTGSGCGGYNNLWVVDDAGPGRAALTLASPWSGINVQYYTNQPGVVVYTCYWMNGAIEIKKGQGVADREGTVKSGGCVALEAQDWSDGINHPEWDRLDDQIFGPGDEYLWETTYKFGIEK
ncbi:aldose 1-epimerase-like protein [Geopyxis carbonaria]|nr:aldose 1-epimerase-like protein [Geopyxis carbonaria]